MVRMKKAQVKLHAARRKPYGVRSSTNPHQLPDGRSRYKRVPSLAQFLRAYGRGAEAQKSREAFAQRVGTSLQYLVQLHLGIRKTRAELALRIERHTHGLVRAEELCADFDWAYLATRKPLDARAPENDTTRQH